MFENILLMKQKTLNNEVIKVDERVKKLRELKRNIKKYESDLLDALKKDLGKPFFEAYTSEILFTLKELDFAIKNVKEFLVPKRVKTPLFGFRSKSFIMKEPYGLVLVLSPWNYPFQLTLAPIISAYATGNRVVVKPSNKTKETLSIMKRIITETFNEDEVLLTEMQAKDVIPELIEKVKFDKIFFTGSTAVGKKINEAAAKTLTPVILELGGKSPCIIDQDANISVSVKRIISSKFFNAGQTCVAPDYLLVHEKIKEPIIQEIRDVIHEFYGKEPIKSKDLGKIINENAFKRLKEYLAEGKIIIGGRTNKDELKIEPTIIEPTNKNKAMKEEIFGPILPIITFKEHEEAIKVIRQNPEPLALYLFTKNKKTRNTYLKEKFGGGCINNAMMHLTNIKLPFGGIGNSGTGRYHGRHGFKAFTYEKSIMKTKNYPDLKIRYPPYKEKIPRILRLF